MIAMEDGPMTESEIKSAIVKTLRQAGALPVVIWQGPMSRKGISDLLVCFDGRFIAIEVKRPGGRATHEQTQFIEEVEQAGGIGFIADNVGEVVERLGLEAKLYPLFEVKA